MLSSYDAAVLCLTHSMPRKVQKTPTPVQAGIPTVGIPISKCWVHVYDFKGLLKRKRDWTATNKDGKTMKVCNWVNF